MTLTRYKFTQDSEEYILTLDSGVNALGVILWRWNDEAEDYETIYDKRLFGYCASCGATHVLVTSAGFDYDVAADIVSGLNIAECECE